MGNDRPEALTWLDRAIAFLSPSAGLRRVRARAAMEIVARHYEAAATGRRTQGWNRSAGSANALAGPAIEKLRAAAHDLVRNNGNAEGAVTTIEDHVVGWGIAAKPKKAPGVPAASIAKAAELWEAWAGTAACDAEGTKDFAGIQRLVMRTVAIAGECLVRKRTRYPEDGLPLPLQLEVLDPDYLDTPKTVPRLQNGGRIVHGIETNVIGKRVAYWLFPEHPGGALMPTMRSRRVPAESVLHVYRQDRPQQLRGVSWFAPVLLKFKDEDEFEDATLMKQKIAACLAVVTSDVDGSSAPVGEAEDTSDVAGLIDSLEPGMIANLPPGRSVDVVNPPTVREFADYSKTTHRAIACGLGISYEDQTGDYSNVNFSSARMSRLRHWARVERWRWGMLIPQLCDPVWSWAMEAAAIVGVRNAPARAGWSPQPMPMIEPDKEGLAYQRNVRSGLMSLSEAIRERGYDPEELLDEMAEDNKRLDRLGIILDSDPRKTTQQGLMQMSTEPPPPRDPNAPAGGAVGGAGGEGDDEKDDGDEKGEGDDEGGDDEKDDGEPARPARPSKGRRSARGRR
ncbi:MAG: phage portal protein [Thermoleophilia bacterium]|nr:phage portal protein [Thermoleophilia bacterium]